MDVLIPYVTASLIDKGINAGDMESVYFYGAVMMGMALLSLVFGILGGVVLPTPPQALPLICVLRCIGISSVWRSRISTNTPPRDSSPV